MLFCFFSLLRGVQTGVGKKTTMNGLTASSQVAVSGLSWGASILFIVCLSDILHQVRARHCFKVDLETDVLIWRFSSTNV